MDNIKAIVYGVGAMGKMMTKFMVEKGVVIVGAIGHVSNIDKDLGEVADLGYLLNVRISDDADAVLSEQKADIAVVALFTEMDTMYPHLVKCLENGLNVITTAEEALYPWPTSPVLTAKLDKLAKKNGVTVTGSGFDEGPLVNFADMLSGGSHHIESLATRQQFNVDDYGPALAEYLHVGDSKDEFDKWLKERPLEYGYSRGIVECQIADLGLSVKSVRQTFEPILTDCDLEAKKLGQLIEKGKVRGMLEVMEVETQQGVRFRSEQIGKAYLPNEEDYTEIYIKGIPDLHLVNKKVATDVVTCAQMVNRIPDVINAEPGYVTAGKLPKLKYRAYPLHFYLGK